MAGPQSAPEGAERIAPRSDFQRGKYIGKRLGNRPPTRLSISSVPACGVWIDCRDLACVFEQEGPLPRPPENADLRWWRVYGACDSKVVSCRA